MNMILEFYDDTQTIQKLSTEYFEVLKQLELVNMVVVGPIFELHEIL